MSGTVHAHRPVAVRERPVDVEPAPLSARDMLTIVAVCLPAFVLAFHLVALASGGAW